MNLNKKSRQSGFTLIELLAVVAILGILAGIAIPRVLGAIENARLRADRANVALLQSAVDRWGMDNNAGGTEASWDTLVGAAAVANEPVSITVATDDLAPRYINAIPLAPSGTRTGTVQISETNPGYGLSLVSTGTAPNTIWSVTVVRLQPGTTTLVSP